MKKWKIDLYVCKYTIKHTIQCKYTASPINPTLNFANSTIIPTEKDLWRYLFGPAPLRIADSETESAHHAQRGLKRLYKTRGQEELERKAELQV